ncbi:MAG: hypothetical protein CL807_06145 [Citromicrobium sp.]|nr:hypothetical protein [Citromicrobium sp.]MAO95289.1 hypothetical protein [Citromicrobium sp.]MAS84884.1 hypothetical protein [Erythrobacteraceae bacterium]MBD76464.1 hypothetical protein [Citromicrobium sp.]MBT46932.1 hypothetical protein [Citromicrobium sp.]|tara:strand:+ start:11582 stop:11890 length:309 start_codon:yes stop_codon:yes gene_type:complete
MSAETDEKSKKIPIPKRRQRLPGRHIVVSDEMRAQLDSELTRSQANIALMARAFPPEFAKVTPTRISNWRTGRAKSADGREWHYVMELLSRLPDANTGLGIK